MDLSRFNNSSFDRGASRSKEALWVLVRLVFFSSSFPNVDFWPLQLQISSVKDIATISDLQADTSGYVKEAEACGLVPISRNGRTVAFIISRAKLGAILEAMELQRNDELMKLVAADKAGKVQFREVPDEL